MEEIVAISLILIAGFTVAPLGVGGGFLYVPILHFILDWDLQFAILYSLIVVWCVSIGSRTAHEQKGFTVAETGRRGRFVAIIGSVFGALSADLIISNHGDKMIKFLAIILLSLVIYRTIVRIYDDHLSKEKLQSEEKELTPRLETKYKAGCFFGGFSAGLIGIGGGVIFTILNRVILGLGPHKAAGTSYLIEMRVVPVAILSHITFSPILLGDLTELSLLFLILPILVIFSAWAGARTAIKFLPQRILIYPYLVAVSISLIRYLIDVIDNLN